MTRWIWVSLPHATFGVGVHGGVVVGAAPIARWAIGKDERKVAAYYRQRGAEFQAIPSLVAASGSLSETEPAA